jgi:hypothetical protein
MELFCRILCITDAAFDIGRSVEGLTMLHSCLFSQFMDVVSDGVRQKEYDGQSKIPNIKVLVLDVHEAIDGIPGATNMQRSVKLVVRRV